MHAAIANISAFVNGSPGVGKTLSARRYSLWDRIQGVKLRDLPEGELQELARVDALLYATPVVNTPREIERDIPKLRDLLRDFPQEPIRREETRRLKQIQKRDADHRDSFFSDYDWFSEKLPTLKPTFGQVCRKYSDKQRVVRGKGCARTRPQLSKFMRRRFIGLSECSNRRQPPEAEIAYVELSWVQSSRLLDSPQLSRLAILQNCLASCNFSCHDRGILG